jgi:hypothetical protein
MRHCWVMRMGGVSARRALMPCGVHRPEGGFCRSWSFPLRLDRPPGSCDLSTA